MIPSDRDLRCWVEMLGDLTEQMETRAWRDDPNLHQRDYIPLVRIAWKAVKDEIDERRASDAFASERRARCELTP